MHPSANEWIQKMRYIHTEKYYTTIQRYEFESFIGEWIEIVMLREMNQTQRVKYGMVSLI